MLCSGCNTGLGCFKESPIALRAAADFIASSNRDLPRTYYKEHQMISDKGWVGVDLDGTLANYGGWIPGGGIGKPIPVMVDRVHALRAAGYTIKIFTARVARGSKETEADVEVMRQRVSDWCQEHLGFRPEVTNIKDHLMAFFLDDRAVQVEPNTGRLLGNPELIGGLPSEVFNL